MLFGVRVTALVIAEVQPLAMSPPLLPGAVLVYSQQTSSKDVTWLGR